MVLGTTVEALDKGISTPMSLILGTAPQERLTDANQDYDNSDYSFDTDGEQFRFGGRQFGGVRVVVEVSR